MSIREAEDRYWLSMRKLQKVMDFQDDSDVADDINELVKRIERLRELHSRCDCCGKTCLGCEDNYPCLTIEALEGVNSGSFN